ncbi:MAG: hypothetical protein HY721_23920 [Planctomycetes bacterium]|nr:hypothetical protein [Planctomycetota bacterium]
MLQQSLQRPRPDLAGLERRVGEALAAPRTLTPQVLQHLLAHHEVRGSDVVPWLKENLAGLESYEHDLLLSPLFTPSLEARRSLEDVLGEGWLDAADLEAMVQDLERRALRVTLLHESYRVEAPLPPVLIERYVRLLHLDSDLPLEVLEPFRPIAPEVRCQLRDRAWARPQARRLLPVLFDAARSAGPDFAGNVRFLTDFVRSHRPASREECVRFLKNLAQAYEDDLESHRSGTRPFFDQELRGAYSGKWKVAAETVAEHERAIATARALLAALGGAA